MRGEADALGGGIELMMMVNGWRCGEDRMANSDGRAIGGFIFTIFWTTRNCHTKQYLLKKMCIFNVLIK